MMQTVSEPLNHCVPSMSTQSDADDHTLPCLHMLPSAKFWCLFLPIY